MHTHHAVQEAVLAPGTDLLTQVPAIVSGPSSLLGVLLPGLNSMLVNRLLSVPWLGAPSIEGWDGWTGSLKLRVCVCICAVKSGNISI